MCICVIKMPINSIRSKRDFLGYKMNTSADIDFLQLNHVAVWNKVRVPSRICGDDW
jgi:hypothetical protein